jgi:hypothetical protein
MLVVTVYESPECGIKYTIIKCFTFFGCCLQIDSPQASFAVFDEDKSDRKNKKALISNAKIPTLDSLKRVRG